MILVALFLATASAFVPSSISNPHRVSFSTTKQWTPPTNDSLGISTSKASFSYKPSSRFYMTNEGSNENKLPMLLDPGTKGGALFLSFVLFLLPIGFYEFVTLALGWDGIDAGRWIGVGFVVITCLLWTSTYIFRVATKDMTYAKQLKDYEDAVIAKRLEELDEDEMQALLEDIDREKEDAF